MGAAAPAAPRTKRAPAKRAQPSTRAARNARALERARNHAPAAPRRKSGPAPARRPVATPAPRAARRVAKGSATILLDRLLRGRAWVALVGVLLVGIVFLNVSVLELNRGIATTDAKSAALERTNSGLRSRVAKLDSAERIQQLAQAKGFILPQPGAITYLKPRPSIDARLAAQRITAPTVTQTAAPQTTAPQTPATQTAAPTTQQAPATQQVTPAAGVPGTAQPPAPTSATTTP
jgi:cell division protein FtsL